MTDDLQKLLGIEDTPLGRLAARLVEEDYGLLENLREARLAAGLTRMEVADSLGCTESDIRRFETNDDPALSTIRRYALAIGVLVEHKITRPDDQAAPPVPFLSTAQEESNE